MALSRAEVHEIPGEVRVREPCGRRCSGGRAMCTCQCRLPRFRCPGIPPGRRCGRADLVTSHAQLAARRTGTPGRRHAHAAAHTLGVVPQEFRASSRTAHRRRQRAYETSADSTTAKPRRVQSARQRAAESTRGWCPRHWPGSRRAANTWRHDRHDPAEGFRDMRRARTDKEQI